MTRSPFDLVCIQNAVLMFLAANWMPIALGVIGILLVVFAPLKWKLLGVVVLVLLYGWYFGIPQIGIQRHFGLAVRQ